MESDEKREHEHYGALSVKRSVGRPSVKSNNVYSDIIIVHIEKRYNSAIISTKFNANWGFFVKVTSRRQHIWLTNGTILKYIV